MKYYFNTNTRGVVEFQESSVVYCLDIVEYERGFGSRVDEKMYFLTEELAKQYQTAYNNEFNNQDHVPDWYMVPQYHGPISIKDIPDHTVVIVNLDLM